MSNERERTGMQRRGRGPMGHGMQPGEKPKDLKGSLGKLLSYIGSFKAAIIVVMIFAAASTVFNVIGPKILGKATTALSEGLMAKIQGTGGIDFTYIGQILLFVLGLYVCSAAFNFIQGWIMTGVTQKICYRMRKEISEKINRMPMKYFESRTYGEVLSRITNDVDTLGQGLNQSITTIITSVATLIGVLIMMLSISPLMTLIAIVILPISMALISFVVKNSQKYFKDQQEYLGHINGQVEEVYGGHLVIKAFNREKDTIDEFNRTNEILYQSAWKSQFLSGMMQPIMMFVGNLGYAAVALSGGLFAIRGTITIGDIQAFIQYVKNFTQPIQQIAQVINQVQSMAAASERVFDFLNEEEEDQTAENPADVTFACIKNPDFNRLHNGDDLWNKIPATSGVSTDPYREYIGEFSGCENLDAYIDLTHLPAGVYEFSLTGFYRGAENAAGASVADENTSVSVYAKGDDGEPVSSFLPAWAAGRHEGKIGQGKELEVADAKGWYVPADGVSAVYYFNQGCYSRTAVRTTVKDGKLRVGISASSSEGQDWVAFDNLRIKYYPYADDATMNMEYLEKLNTRIEEAKALLDGTSNPAGKEDLSAAITAAQKVYNDQPAWTVSQQAVFDLEDAVEAFNKAQESGSVVDAIKEHKGDASFLLPKITAWTIQGSNVVRNEVTDENWDGLSDSPAGLIKVTGGTATTHLSGMPAGTYRMVAAVRGPKNNRILTSVNNQDETAVILPGWNLDEVGTAPIINTNGVQMTAAAGDAGYNSGYNCKKSEAKRS